jgi:hypothetical protein
VLVEAKALPNLLLCREVAVPPSRNPGECVYSEPIILPLNADGEIYALEDEQGRLVGTGTREICEALLRIMKNEAFLFRRKNSDQSDRNS